MDKQIVYCCFYLDNGVDYCGRFLAKIFNNKTDAEEFVSAWDILKLKKPRWNSNCDNNEWELWIQDHKRYKKYLYDLGYEIDADYYYIEEHELN